MATFFKSTCRPNNFIFRVASSHTFTFVYRLLICCGRRIYQNCMNGNPLISCPPTTNSFVYLMDWSLRRNTFVSTRILDTKVIFVLVVVYRTSTVRRSYRKVQCLKCFCKKSVLRFMMIGD